MLPTVWAVARPAMIDVAEQMLTAGHLDQSELHTFSAHQ